MGLGGQRHTPAALPPGKTRYPLYTKLGWTQGNCGRVRKISLPAGIRSSNRPARTSRYTDLMIPDHQKLGDDETTGT